MSRYWQERLMENIYDNNSKILEKKILLLYKQANKNIDAEVVRLWLRMLEDGEISYATLYKASRFRDLQNAIQRELYKLGEVEQVNIQLSLLDGFKGAHMGTNAGYGINTSWTLFNDRLAKQIVNANFKGATFSERIWKNKDALRQTLERKIVDTAINGQDVRKASREIRDRFGVAYSDSERLVRTETMRVLNSGQMESYISNGYTQYRYLASIDNRTSEICEELNGEVFNFSDAIVGVNYPPLHVNCRSTVIPVIN